MPTAAAMRSFLVRRIRWKAFSPGAGGVCACAVPIGASAAASAPLPKSDAMSLREAMVFFPS